MRRTSGTQNPSRTLLPSPRFEEPLPRRPTLDERTEDEEAVEGESSQFGPATFQPFFALIEDSATNEHHHPTVHYIFADDDADIITEAAFRSLELDKTSELHETSQVQDQEQEEDEGKLPPYDHRTREHYLILDVQPVAKGSSYEVTSAHSLSSEWQVLRTNITTAPTFNAEAPDVEDGLMLKIEGRGNTPPDAESEKNRIDKEKESLEAMVERFQKRLDDIRRTMEAGGHRGGGLSHEHLAE